MVLRGRRGRPTLAAPPGGSPTRRPAFFLAAPRRKVGGEAGWRTPASPNPQRRSPRDQPPALLPATQVRPPRKPPAGHPDWRPSQEVSVRRNAGPTPRLARKRPLVSARQGCVRTVCWITQAAGWEGWTGGVAGGLLTGVVAGDRQGSRGRRGGVLSRDGAATTPTPAALTLEAARVVDRVTAREAECPGLDAATPARRKGSAPQGESAR